MRRLRPLPILALAALVSCSAGQDPVDSRVVARPGTAPVIDGVIDHGEWADAARIEVDSVKTIYLKHDRENLYIALNGDGGNLYFLKNDRIHILHASWSLTRIVTMALVRRR